MEPVPTSRSAPKITYAITKDNWGGAQAYVYTLACAAEDQGALVSVLLGSSDRVHSSTSLSARLSEAAIPVTSLSHIRRDIGIISEWRAFIELLETLKSNRPEVLHLNSAKMGILGALAGRIAGVPQIVFTAHGWSHRESRNLVWKAIVWLASWLTVFLSHKVIVVSKCDLRTAPAIFLTRKLVHIYNGTPAFTYKPRSEAREYLQEKAPGLSEFSVWIVMNAELHRNKGIDIALRSLKEITRTHLSVALVLQGAGEELDSLTKLAKDLGVADRVFFLGFIQDARANLAAADIFLMPSRKEGLPLALLEAAHLSIPSIASAVGGIPEIITHGEGGLLVSPEDTTSLTRAITQYLTNPDNAKKLGTKLHEHTARTFSQEQMLRETFSVYD